MITPAYLIDTNVIIGLEDNHPVQPAFAALHSIASRHGVRLFVHEAARDDIIRDRDEQRRHISLSKIEKYPRLGKVRGLTSADLRSRFGVLKRPNDVVDATLLHALEIGAADFLVTEDNELHNRGRRRSSELGRRVLHVADAVELLRTTYEPKAVPVRYVEEVLAHTLNPSDTLFESLRSDYPDFDDWWQQKCVREHRPCWVIDDGELAGLVVRKDEAAGDSDATFPGDKILKVCTFKVRPEKRDVPMKDSGVEWLGEVPAHWDYGKVRYFAQLESGHTPSRSKPEYWENCTIPWFTLSDVWQIRSGLTKIVYETKEKVSALGLANSSARLLPARTVILSRTASVGYSAILGKPMATTQDFANWICGNALKPEFLLAVFQVMKSEFSRLMMGSTHKTIYMPDIAELYIAVPSITEQLEIVDFLGHETGRIDALVEEAKLVIKLLWERRSALISAAVTGKIDVRNWKMRADAEVESYAMAAEPKAGYKANSS